MLTNETEAQKQGQTLKAELEETKEVRLNKSTVANLLN